MEKNKGKLVPYQRIGNMSDIGRTCVNLDSEDSDFMTGYVLVSDVGMTARTPISVEGMESKIDDVGVN